MGLFGFSKKKRETIELPPEEPEFLRKIDLPAQETTQGVREQVEPELALWFSNGTAVTGLKELASALKKMKAGDYKEQVNPERNDIAEWVQEILNDFGLARKLRQAKGRLQAAKAVEMEIKALKSAKKSKKTTSAKKTATGKVKAKKIEEKPELQLPEIPEFGGELQNLPLPETDADKKKGGLFSRLFGKKPKEEVHEQPIESIPTLPEFPGLPELTEEPKATKDIIKKLTKKEKIAARKAEKEQEELLPQLSENEKALEAAEMELQNQIEMPRAEDFQLEMPAEAANQVNEKKGLLSFLFKRKGSVAEATQPADFSGLPQLQIGQNPIAQVGSSRLGSPAEAGLAHSASGGIVPGGSGQDKQESHMPSASEFEPEPQHARWEELPTTAELPEPVNEKVKEPEPAITARASKQKPSRQREDYDNIELIRQDHEIERAEKELIRQEEDLNNRRLELTRKRYDLIKQKGELESRKFEDFIRKHKNRNEKEEAIAREGIYSQGGVRESMPDFTDREPRGQLRGMPDFRLSSAYGKERLEGLLEEAKQHIRENNMTEAQNALHEVQSVLDTVYMTNNEKKLIEYDILEVEADLKLASLK